MCQAFIQYRIEMLPSITYFQIHQNKEANSMWLVMMKLIGRSRITRVVSF
jgi:hypothetical protein